MQQRIVKGELPTVYILGVIGHKPSQMQAQATQARSSQIQTPLSGTSHSAKPLGEVCLRILGATTGMTSGTLWLYGNLKYTPTGARAHHGPPLGGFDVPDALQTLALSAADQGIAQPAEDQDDQSRAHPRHPHRVGHDLRPQWDPLPVLDAPQLSVHRLSRSHLPLHAFFFRSSFILSCVAHPSRTPVIYPAVIVLLVSLERTHLGLTLTVSGSQPVHFVSGAGAMKNHLTNLEAEAEEDTPSNHDSRSDLAATKEKAGSEALGRTGKVLRVGVEL
ncbi:hypothetical protein FB451DRAFT_1185648 [Mycena latifolia]|nr:hypothetical protein FB451DRAFT_1185648 [Mycena latifolia]